MSRILRNQYTTEPGPKNPRSRETTEPGPKNTRSRETTEPDPKIIPTVDNCIKLCKKLKSISQNVLYYILKTTNIKTL
jgi:hypothetical protein